MRAMAYILLFLSLWMCSSAQLIYPDQFEMMRSSAAPPYYPSVDADQSSRLRPGSFRQVVTVPVSPMNYTVPEAYVPYNAQAINSGLSGNNAGLIQVISTANERQPAFAQAVASAQALASSQAAVTDNPLQQWDNHVNNVITKGIMKFALDMEREIYKSQSPATGYPNNIIFSPLSLSVALAMVLLGSAGRTFDEVSRVLGLETGVDISTHSELVHQMFGLLLNRVHDKMVASPGPRIDLASAVFVQDGYSIRPEFKTICENVYKSEVINLDFYRKGKEAQDVVNAWVKQKTMGKIASILTDIPPPATSVILASALYFNGEWNQHFITGATARKPFYIEPNQAIEVNMMYNGGVFPYYEDKSLGVKVLELPYKGHEFSMYILLPNAQGANALRSFQSQLTADILGNLLDSVKNETCIIGLPRMKLSSTLHLRSTLARLGLSSLFDSQTADLSLLSPGYNKESMPPMMTLPSPPSVASVPTVSPLLTPYIRPGKSNGEPVKTTTTDYFVFPRFGGDEQTDKVRKNYFTYEDKVRGLTVEQWSSGFSIGKTRRLRRNVRKMDKSLGEQSGLKVSKNKEESRHSYVVNESNENLDDTKIVKLEDNKYQFQSGREKRALRGRRQIRPINQDFLNYVKSKNFPTYGLDALRNSANLVNPHLYASDVLHKVEIDITEKGTEAAAVTAVLLERDGSQKRIVANRPFLFVIRNNPTKLILFWGTLNVPTPNYSVT